MNPLNGTLAMISLLAAALAGSASRAEAASLEVCATVPELGSLARAVGGDDVRVTVFAKPTEDPHFVEPRPSFVKVLSRADVYVQNGLDLDTAWAAALLQKARNAAILPGAPGYVDASTAIEPLEVPATAVDRSMGDVHAYGNPHYLLDPLNGLRVAKLLAARLGELRPERRAVFDERLAEFRRRLGAALVGEELAERYDFEKLAKLHEHGKLGDFLKRQDQADRLGGWIGTLIPYWGASVVTDHKMWPYFARRFGLRIAGALEPKPGIPPTTSHMQDLIGTMTAKGTSVILAAAYYDPRHAEFLSKHTGAQIARMANQAGARPGTEDYLAMVDYNVRELAARLGKAR